MPVIDEMEVGDSMDATNFIVQGKDNQAHVELTKELVETRIQHFLDHLELVQGWPSGMNSHKQTVAEFSEVVLEGLKNDFLTPSQAHELVLTASLSLAEHLKRQRGHKNSQKEG